MANELEETAIAVPLSPDQVDDLAWFGQELTPENATKVRIFATWNSPAPHWTEVTGENGHPAFRGRCRKKVYRTFTHAAADARTIRHRDGQRDAAGAYWCRRCRGFHVGRPGGSRHERVFQIRPGSDLRAA
jgi:hypothetical protein